VSALGLGTAQLGLPYGVSNRDGRPSEAEAAAIVGRALEHGVRVFDTAPAYGEAEALLGRLLPADADVRVVTKTAPGGEGGAATPDTVRRAVERSLERLRRDSLDALLVHHGSELAGPGGGRLATCLLELRDAGLARRLGVSVYDRAELDAARELLPLDLVQLPLNAFDRRLAADGTIDELHAAGVEVHARSAFLQGLLLMKPEELPAGLAAAEPPLRRFHKLRRERGLGPIEAALGAVREVPGVDVVLVGVNSARELDECAAAIGAAAGPAIDPAEIAIDDPTAIDPRRWPA
jgi:aryl-alcohol dehydrogenase-like predicted oxidoreductase